MKSSARSGPSAWSPHSTAEGSAIQIITLNVGVPDLQASALGGKAVGEFGIVGVAAAIGNAVYHATGKHIRDLSITMDKLISEV